MKNNKIDPWILTWYGINKRCYQKNSKTYKYYGAKGIKNYLTKEELKEMWFRDKAYKMVEPSIDREDKTKDYTFNNCRYIEMDENRAKEKRKPVLQYDLNGNFIKEWKSIKEAERILKIQHVNIGRSCKNIYGYKSAGGFIWRFKDEFNGQNQITKIHRDKTYKKVLQYDKNMNFIEEYEGLTLASEATGVSLKNISCCFRGKSKTAGGFIWKSKDN